jgi:hypothetical protein
LLALCAPDNEEEQISISDLRLEEGIHLVWAVDLHVGDILMFGWKPDNEVLE